MDDPSKIKTDTDACLCPLAHELIYYAPPQWSKMHIFIDFLRAFLTCWYHQCACWRKIVYSFVSRRVYSPAPWTRVQLRNDYQYQPTKSAYYRKDTSIWISNLDSCRLCMADVGIFRHFPLSWSVDVLWQRLTSSPRSLSVDRAP